MNEERKNYDLEHRRKVEQSILGAIINSDFNKSNVYDTVTKHNLKPEDFFWSIHRDIFQSILICFEQKASPTLVAITQFRPDQYRYNNSEVYSRELKYLIDITIASDAMLYHDIFMLKQYALMEFWNTQAHDLLYGNWNGRDVLQVSETLIKEYNGLMNRYTAITKSNSEEDDYEAEIERKVENFNKGIAVGLTTSLPKADKFLDGWNPAELIIIAGRPGMGKTTYSLINAYAISKQGIPIIFFSLEMPKNQLKSKLISLETGIPYKRIKRGQLNVEELASVKEWGKRIDDSCFYIEDKIKTLEDIYEKTEEYVRTKGIKGIVVDYIQRCKTREGGKLREVITSISRELKSIAKEFYIPVIALSQLNRNVETRTNKRPLLSDLKESGSIEEDADIVVFLYRDAYYKAQDNIYVGRTQLFHTEFIIGKGRDTGTNTLEVYIDAIDMKMIDFEVSGDYTAHGGQNFAVIYTDAPGPAPPPPPQQPNIITTVPTVKKTPPLPPKQLGLGEGDDVPF